MQQNDICLIAEEKDFLVVNKPPGVGMHNDGGEQGMDALIKERFGSGELSAVHRLDKGTSGVLLIAKNKPALSKLSQLFQNRQIEKYYWAISAKKPKKKQGTIDGGMAKARDGSWKLTRSKENRALTQFFSYGLGEGMRAFLVKPHTGKTHQIRVALKSLGSPILGDIRYRGESADRLYLHAASLKFVYESSIYSFHSTPLTGEHFRSDLFLSLCSDV